MVLSSLLQCGIAEVVFEERAVYFQGWVAYFICITLSRVPIFLSLFCIPRVVKIEIQEYSKDSFGSKLHFVWWNIICTGKSKGGGWGEAVDTS